MQQKLLINKKYSSNSFDERNGQKIKFLILHFTAQDFETSLRLLQDKVSVHYLISKNPAEVFGLVAEDKRAWHAGESFWAGQSGLNASSIGIEIVNLDGNTQPYPEDQIDLLITLCQEIIARHNIAPECILGHSDIAPLRKDDPGVLFPWQRLFENGIGMMPNYAKVDELVKNIELPSALILQENLAKFGYKIDLSGVFDQQTQMVLDAFRRHFCPEMLGQKIDKRTFAALLSFL